MDVMRFVDFAGSGVINDKCLLANNESKVNAGYQVARQFVMMFLGNGKGGLTPKGAYRGD